MIPMRHLLVPVCLSLFLAAAPASIAAHHQAGYDPAAASRTSASALELKPDPAVRYGVLDNGLRYAILANDTPEGSGALWMHFDVGSLAEEDDQRGLAHYLEHMAFNGSENVPEGEMVQILERHGLAFGADTNAFTSLDQTVYTLDLPNLDDETLDAAFFLFRETADKLTITDAAVDRERGVILSEQRTGDTAQFRALQAQWAFFFPDARFKDRLPIGLVEVIETAPAQRLRDLYEAYYRPERAFLVFVGDAEPDAIKARIIDSFADWEPLGPDGEDPAAGAYASRDLAAGYHFDPDVRPSLTLAAIRPTVDRPDTVENRIASLQRWIGNAILNRRFQRLSRTPDAVFLNAQAGHTSLYDHADMASVVVLSAAENWAEALAVGEQELRRALEYGFTEAERAEQLAIVRNAFESRTERAGTRQSSALAESLVSAFNDEEVFTHPADDLAQFEVFADALNLDAVEAAFRAQWTGVEPQLFFSSNVALDNAQSAILEAFEASRAAPVEPLIETEALSFAYSDFGAPGLVASQEVVAGLSDGVDFTAVRFENGVRLTVASTDFEDDRVRVVVRVGGGVLEMPIDRPGLNTLASQTFITGGLEAHPVDAIQSLIAGRTVGLGFSLGEDAFVFSGGTSPDDLELQLQLFAAYLIAPGYRPEALAQLRQAVESVYDTLDATPGAVFQNEGARVLRSGDSRYGLAAKTDLLARTSEELDAALSRALNEGAIEIAIVGDVETDAAIAYVASTFGALAARDVEPRAFQAARTVRFPDPGGDPFVLTHGGEANRAMMFTAWPTIDDSDVDAVRALALLRRVLSLKLIDQVREAEGATYSPSAVSAHSSVHPGYGYIGVSLDLVPDDVDRFFSIVDDIAAELAAGDISADEFERARAPLMESLEEQLQSNSYWLGLASRAQSDPERIARHFSRRAGYAALTVQDVSAVAAQYLTPENAFRLAILPETAPTATGGEEATQ